MVFVAVRSCEDSVNAMHECAYSLCGEMLKNIGIYSPVERLENGKPVTTGAFISISHSHGAVCCAVNAEVQELNINNARLFSYSVPFGEVGVDIELIDKTRKTDLVAEKIFSAAENKSLQNGDKYSLFFGIYTRKEAYLKKTGAGLSGIRNADTCALSDTFITEQIKLNGKEYIFSICS